MNHGQMVKLAAEWLKNHCKCRVVASELNITLSEVPDAIGWKASGESIVVECKASISDLKADEKKRFNRLDYAMGDWKYYFLTDDIDPVAVPTKYGIIRKLEYGLMIERKPAFRERHEKSFLAERRLLATITYRAMEALRLTKQIDIGDAS